MRYANKFVDCLPVGAREVPGMDEVWVTQDGRVFLWERRWCKLRELLGHSVRDHLLVGIRGHYIYAHRLVLLAFVGPPKPGQQCRHMDGNPKNNHVTNLKWGTNKENAEDRASHGTDIIGENHKHAKMNENSVRELRRMASAGATFASLGKRFGIAPGTAWTIARRLKWKHVA